jgi:hypothetical protein
MWACPLAGAKGAIVAKTTATKDTSEPRHTTLALRRRRDTRKKPPGLIATESTTRPAAHRITFGRI